MRNLLSGVIATVALATVLAGAASAADTMSRDSIQQAGGNLAVQGELERDAAERTLHHSLMEQVIAPATSSNSQAQAAVPHSSRDE